MSKAQGPQNGFNKKVKVLLGIIALGALITVAVMAYSSLSEDFDPQSSVGGAGAINQEESQAADFTAYDSQGGKVKLSDYYGKPVVLNFWASWCPPCKSEMKDFNKVHQEMKDQVTFLMVDMVDGQKETKEQGRAYVEAQGFTFNVAYDLDQEAAYTYKVRALPTTVFINSGGSVVTTVNGAIDEKTLRENIEKVLKSK